MNRATKSPMRCSAAVTLAASSRRLSPAMQPARQLRESLSLGALGVARAHPAIEPKE